MRQFGSKPSLVEPLVQLFHDPSRPSQIRGPLIALHQFLDDRRIDFRPLYLFAFSWYFLFSHFHLYSLGCDTHTNFPTSSSPVSCLLSPVSSSYPLNQHLRF